MPRLFYQNEIDDSNTCEQKTPQTIEAIRYCHNPINAKPNFTAVVENTPNRFPRNAGGGAEDCKVFSLSCFNSEEQAIARIRKLVKRNPDIMLNIGDHLCSGTINIQDGECGDINDTGHFSFFKYEDITIIENFNITKAIQL